MDEHFSFPETYGGVVIDNGYYGEKLPSLKDAGLEDRYYDVVFQGSWISDYDLAIYMEIDPEVVLERFRSSEGDKNNPYITKEDIRLWQLFELDRIQHICNLFSVPLYYIYNHEKSGEELSTIVMYHLRRCCNRQKKEPEIVYEV